MYKNKQPILIAGYLFIGGFISHIFPEIPDVVKSIVAMPALFFLPYLVGYSIVASIKLLEPPKINQNDLSFNQFWYWIIGTILIVTFAYIFYFFHIFNLNTYTLFILCLSTILLYKIYKKSMGTHLNAHIRNCYMYDKIFLLVIFFGFTSAFFITEFSPFPYIWANDIFRHNGITLTIIENNNLPMLTPYLLTMQIIFSMISTLFNIDQVYVLFWSLRFLTYPLLAIGTYLLSFELSNNKRIALFASILAIWQFYTLYQFAPKTLIIMLFPFALYYMIKVTDKYDILKELKLQPGQFSLLLVFTMLTFVTLYQHLIIKEYIGLLLITLFISSSIFLKNRFYFFIYVVSLVALLTHITMGLAITIFIYVYIISFSLLKSNINWKLYTLLFILISVILLKEMAAHDIVFTVYSDIPGDKVDMDLSNKINIINEIFPTTTVMLASFGSFLLFMKSKKIKEISILLLFITVIFLYLLPISGSIRFINIATALIAYMGAITINYIIKMDNKLISGKIKNVISTLIIICLLLLLVTHNIDMVNKKSNGEFTQIDNNLYLAGLWVRENTDENTLIISDLMSQEIVAGLSNRKKIGMLMKSRYFPSKYPQYNEIVRILSTNNPEEAYARINNLKKTETVFGYPTIYESTINGTNLTPLIIIDKKRTTRWADMSEEGFTKFSDDIYFEEIYSQDGIYIYTLK